MHYVWGRWFRHLIPSHLPTNFFFAKSMESTILHFTFQPRADLPGIPVNLPCTSTSWRRQLFSKIFSPPSKVAPTCHLRIALCWRTHTQLLDSNVFLRSLCGLTSDLDMFFLGKCFFFLECEKHRRMKLFQTEIKCWCFFVCNFFFVALQNELKIDVYSRKSV